MSEAVSIKTEELKNISRQLIRDRTRADVDYALDCGRGGIYAEENLRGAYNISDRNRVGMAVNYISRCLGNTGIYEARANMIRDDWNAYDIASPGDNGEVLDALTRLKQILPYDKTAAVPETLDNLTYQKANAVESIIYDLYGVFSRLTESWLYCGDGSASDFDPFNWQGWDGNVCNS